MTPKYNNVTNDQDLPPIARTEANLWKVKAFELMRELTKANKGIRRIKAGCDKANANAAELKKLQGFYKEIVEFLGHDLVIKTISDLRSDRPPACTKILEEWLEFSKDVRAGCAAGHEQLDSLRRRTLKEIGPSEKNTAPKD